MVKHRFNVGQMIYCRYTEEVYTITKLKFINGHPLYYVKEVTHLIADYDCILSSNLINA